MKGDVQFAIRVSGDRYERTRSKIHKLEKICVWDVKSTNSAISKPSKPPPLGGYITLSIAMYIKSYEV